MLPDEQAVALHDAEPLLLLQEHPHEGGLGQGLVDARRHVREFPGGQELGEEARAVVGEDPRNALADVGRDARRRVDGEIAALGVAPDDELAVETARDVGQVARRRDLGGHGAAEGQVEVLLPAHERGVRAPERDVGQVVGQPERHGGELLLGPHVRGLDVADDAHVAQPRTGGRGGQQAQAVLLAPHAREVVPEVLGPVQVRQAHAVPPADPGHDLVRVRGDPQVRHPGQDQAVHRAQPAPGERLKLPARVVQHIARARRRRPRRLHGPRRPGPVGAHSHSMVPGGLEVQSSTTRLTSGTALVMRVEMRASTS